MLRVDSERCTRGNFEIGSVSIATSLKSENVLVVCCCGDEGLLRIVEENE